MAKIGLLLPEQNMVDAARRLIDEMGNSQDIVLCKMISSPEAVNEARQAAEMGAEILIARGHQARQIRQNTQIPLVEIRFTGLEIGLFMQRAHEMTGLARPHVALVAFENMLPDVTRAESLFHVKLTVLYIDRYQDAEEALRKMPEAPDVVIGGPYVCEAAENLGYPAFGYEGTGESLAEALRTAKSLSYAIDAEKRNTAQMETLLDASLSGIIRVDASGTILAINTYLAKETGTRKNDACGKPLHTVFPQLSASSLEKVLRGEEEYITTSAQIRGEAWMVQMAAIAYEENISGAIISLRKIAELTEPSGGMNRSLRSGFSTSLSFKDIPTENAQMKEVLERARRYALSSSPILIIAPVGTKPSLVAQAIHNNSAWSAGPFVRVIAGEIEPEKQVETLFLGRPATQTARAQESVFAKADHGTVYLQGVDCLTMQAQLKLLRTMMNPKIMRTDALPMGIYDVRVIAASTRPLEPMVREGTFSEALFYRLKGLELTIPPFRERPEDLFREFKEDLSYFSKKYSRSFQITEGGRRRIRELPWPGNLTQLRAFTERLVLTATRRQIDEVMLQQLYDEMYPETEIIGGSEKIVVYDSPEGRKIREMLVRYNGSREKVAAALGISTTTLWRHMKKYGIEANYR